MAFRALQHPRPISRKLIPRFSIRGLLLTHLLIALVLAVFIARVLLPYQWESRRIAEIRRSSPSAQLFTEPRGQYLFRHFVGDHYSQRLVWVHLKDSDIDDQWIAENLSGLKFIEGISITSSSLTDSSIKHLDEALPNLRRLTLTNTKVTETAIAELRETRKSGRFILQTR